MKRAGGALTGAAGLTAAALFGTGLALLQPGALDLVGQVLAFTVILVLALRLWPTATGRRLSWVLLILAGLDALGTFADGYARAGLLGPSSPWPGASWTLAFSSTSWLFAYAGLTYLTLVFPDGRLTGRRILLARVGAVTFAGAWLGALTQPGAFPSPYEAVVNPAGITWVGGPGELLVGAFMLGSLAVMAATVVDVALRMRRAGGDSRAQLKLVLLAFALVPCVLALCFLLRAVGLEVDAILVAFDFAIVAVPLAVTAAVLRYRLHGVDRLVSRTVTYVVLTVALAGTFALVTLLVGSVTGRRSPWAASAGTLVAVLAFRPLRDRIQRAIDRRFDRGRYDALEQVEDYLRALRKGTASPDELEPVIATALGDPGLKFEPGPVGGEAHITTSPGSHVRPDVAAEVLSRLALAIEVQRLREELAGTLAEVSASRTRIVQASYEERRRLERDLHDGAQQRLVSLGISLARLRRSLPNEARVLEPALQQAVDGVAAALTDLRRLAAGVRPARLDDGLSEALHDLARSIPVPMEVRTTTDRAPAPVETAAYFIACEAVTNAVRHSGATRISLEASRADQGLQVVVTDDGVGGADVEAGSGLAGLADRVAAHGGTFSIDSAPGTGTRMEVLLPCEW